MNLQRRVSDLLGEPVGDLRPLGGGDICRAWRADGVFVKESPNGATGMLVAEAAGLRWLADAGAAVPDVLAVAEDVLVLSWVEPAALDRAALGRLLARLHDTTEPAFGLGPPGAPQQGWIGSAPMTYGRFDSWPEFFAEERIRPYAERARLTRDEAAVIDEVCGVLPELAGPPVPPARLHGDLWSGNVLGSGSGPILIDPAAHSGHPESDLAMLALFPPAGLQQILASYEEARPLSAGWRERVGLHQLYPLLVHAVLFGGGYGASAAARARALLDG